MIAPALRLTHVARSDVGAVREVNEDSFIARPDIGLWAVADGMGGFENGDWASAAVVESLSKLSPTEDFDRAAREVADAIHAANAVIYDKAAASGRNMGSTAAALMIQGARFAVFWAGDSRVYLLRDGELIRMTEDHTRVQELVAHGLLTAEEAAHHPMMHVISRAVGVEPTLELDAVVDEALVGDLFMICSDGLYGVVSDAEIAEAMIRDSENAAEKLVDLCLSRGAPDNVTVVAIACDEITLLSLAPEGV